jgi:hypothetical protein
MMNLKYIKHIKDVSKIKSPLRTSYIFAIVSSLAPRIVLTSLVT